MRWHTMVPDDRVKVQVETAEQLSAVFALLVEMSSVTSYETMRDAMGQSGHTGPLRRASAASLAHDGKPDVMALSRLTPRPCFGCSYFSGSVIGATRPF